MMIKLKYDQLFTANDRNSLTKTSMQNTNVHELASMPPYIIDLWFNIGFEVEVLDKNDKL